MRIGEFANKYEVKKSTIRYYTDLGLLLPDKTGKYPDYHEKCDADMKHIVMLKDMGFAVDEIVMIINYERVNVSFADYEREAVKAVFERKIDVVNSEIQSFMATKNRLEEYLKLLHISNNHEGFGLHYHMLEDLRCSKCNSGLKLQDIEAKDQMVKDVRLMCKGHEEWVTIKGILTNNPLAKVQQQSRRSIESIYEYMEAFDMNQYHTMASMGEEIISIMNQWDHQKGIVFLAADADLVLIRIDQNMRKDGRYIFINHDIHDLDELYQKLSALQPKGKMLFLHTEDRVPSGLEADYLVDNCSNYYDFASDKPNLISWRELVETREYTEVVSTQFIDAIGGREPFNEDIIDDLIQRDQLELIERETIAQDVRLVANYREGDESYFEMELLLKRYKRKQ